jgi:hypothetical protein
MDCFHSVAQDTEDKGTCMLHTVAIFKSTELCRMNSAVSTKQSFCTQHFTMIIYKSYVFWLCNATVIMLCISKLYEEEIIQLWPYN